MMKSKKRFSLRSLFLWCSVAAALLSVVGLGYRGVEWASGSSWRCWQGLIALVISALYWIAHRVAFNIEGIKSRFAASVPGNTVAN